MGVGHAHRAVAIALDVAFGLLGRIIEFAFANPGAAVGVVVAWHLIRDRLG